MKLSVRDSAEGSWVGKKNPESKGREEHERLEVEGVRSKHWNETVNCLMIEREN